MGAESPSIFASVAALLLVAAGLSFMLQLKRVASKLILVAIGLLLMPAIFGSVIAAATEQGYGIPVRLALILLMPVVLIILALLLVQGFIGAIFGRGTSAVAVGTLIADLIRGAVRLLVVVPVGLFKLIRRGFDK